jgi:hypothetical protein
VRKTPRSLFVVPTPTQVATTMNDGDREMENSTLGKRAHEEVAENSGSSHLGGASAGGAGAADDRGGPAKRHEGGDSEISLVQTEIGKWRALVLRLTEERDTLRACEAKIEQYGAEARLANLRGDKMAEHKAEMKAAEAKMSEHKAEMKAHTMAQKEYARAEEEYQTAKELQQVALAEMKRLSVGLGASSIGHVFIRYSLRALTLFLTLFCRTIKPGVK